MTKVESTNFILPRTFLNYHYFYNRKDANVNINQVGNAKLKNMRLYYKFNKFIFIKNNSLHYF